MSMMSAAHSAVTAFHNADVEPSLRRRPSSSCSQQSQRSVFSVVAANTPCFPVPRGQGSLGSPPSYSPQHSEINAVAAALDNMLTEQLDDDEWMGTVMEPIDATPATMDDICQCEIVMDYLMLSRVDIGPQRSVSVDEAVAHIRNPSSRFSRNASARTRRYSYLNSSQSSGTPPPPPPPPRSPPPYCADCFDLSPETSFPVDYHSTELQGIFVNSSTLASNPLPVHLAKELLTQLEQEFAQSAKPAPQPRRAVPAVSRTPTPPPIEGVILRQHSPYQKMARSDVIPKGCDSNDRIMVIAYVVSCPTQLRYRRPSERPQLKMGGVWMELGATVIGSLIQFLTGVAVEAVEMFQINQGRCALVLADPVADSGTVITLLHKRLWLGPSVALYAMSEIAAVCLSDYVERIRKLSTRQQKFPRHLVTVEPWLTKEEYRQSCVAKSLDSDNASGS